jgi:hypothetical protein
MHAVLIDDGQLRWQERPDPQAGDHDGVRDAAAAYERFARGGKLGKIVLIA